MLLAVGRLELELILNPKKWGFTYGRTEMLDSRAGFYITVGPFRLEWYPSGVRPTESDKDE